MKLKVNLGVYYVGDEITLCSGNMCLQDVLGTLSFSNDKIGTYSFNELELCKKEKVPTGYFRFHSTETVEESEYVLDKLQELRNKAVIFIDESCGKLDPSLPTCEPYYIYNGEPINKNRNDPKERALRIVLYDFLMQELMEEGSNKNIFRLEYNANTSLLYLFCGKYLITTTLSLKEAADYLNERGFDFCFDLEDF